MMCTTKVLLYKLTFSVFMLITVNSKRHDFDIDENLLQKRCELICHRKPSDKCSIKSCVENSSKLTKPGRCSDHRTLNATCFNDCAHYDYECPGITKCCKRDCGWSCESPVGLDKEFNLPPIPFNVTVVERRKRMCEISWQITLNFNQKLPIYFIVEARSHIGEVFSKHKLSNWQLYNFHKIAEMIMHDSHTKTTVANIKLKPGRWYQFRVAALNEHGFRGYSNHSRATLLSDSPKPPRAPKNFTVSLVQPSSNGTMYVKVQWSAPKSDLPIEKYRIRWALYLKGDKDSLWINETYVRESSRYYEFWNLARNSVYYLQVQAISISGRKRLKSPKEALLLNLTEPVSVVSLGQKKHFTFINSTDQGINTKNGLRNAGKARPSDITVRFIANKKYGMLVRVLWNEHYRDCLVELCADVSNCERKEYGIARPKKEHVDFGRLKFETQYTVRILDANNIEGNSVLKTKTFITPTQEVWLKRFPFLSIEKL